MRKTRFYQFNLLCFYQLYVINYFNNFISNILLQTLFMFPFTPIDLAGKNGFEPISTVLETAVLPLDDSPIK